MRGYLLDTNIVALWFRQEPSVLGSLGELPTDTPVMTSVIVLGEMEYGHKVVSPSEMTPIQVQFRQFVYEHFPKALPIVRTTTAYYGQLRAKLFAKYAPGKHLKAVRAEQLIDPATSKELGVQENDLWMAAQAIEHNLVLVTHDKMIRIKDVAEDLEAEDWAV